MDGVEAARRSAGGPDRVRRRPGRDRRLVRRQRGLVARGPLGRLGRLLRAPVRGAARPVRRGAGRAPTDPPADARRRHRVPTGRLGRARSSPPWPMRRSPARRAARRGTERPSTSTRPTASARASTATGPRSWSTPRPGPTSTAAPATRTSRCAQRRRDRRPGARPARSAGSTSSRSRRTRSSTAGAPTASAMRPTTRPRRPTRTAPRSSPASAPRPTPSTAPRRRGRRGGRLGIVRTAWLFGPPGRDFPRKILEAAERAAAAGEPLRVVGDEWGTPTYAADVADAIVELLAEDAHAGVHHLVNGAVRRRARSGREYVVAPVRDRRSPSSTSRARPGSARPTPPRWGVLAATPLPSGEPLRPWPDAMADYAPAPRACVAPGAGRAVSPERPPRPCPASASARSSASRTRGARSASCGARAPSARSTRPTPAAVGGRATFVQANLSTSAAGVLRGLHCHRRQLDHWIVASGRAFVALVDVRPLLDGTQRTAERRDARAGRGRLGRHPERGRARVPGARAARAAVSRDERVRRHRRAGLRLGRPGRRGPVAARSWDAGRTPDPLGPRPHEPATGRAAGASAPHGDLTRTTPLRTMPLGDAPMGLERPDHPAIVAAGLRDDGEGNTPPFWSPRAPNRRDPRPRHARGPRRLRARGERGSGWRQGRDHRRRDARRDVLVPLQGELGLRGGDQVHLERRQGLQPERDVVQGQGRGQGRVDRHLLRPRQRLAEPVHVRPQVHDEGRIRAQRDGRQWRQQQQVLRRAVCRDARPRAERRRPAEPPLLRVGKLRAGRQGPERRPPPASASRTSQRAS